MVGVASDGRSNSFITTQGKAEALSELTCCRNHRRKCKCNAVLSSVSISASQTWKDSSHLRHDRGMYAHSRSLRPKVLSGTVICCSGFDSDESLSAFSERVSALGGTYTSDLAPNVTHLVCTKAGSAKHRQACLWNLELGPDRPRLEIVQPSWLDAVENAAARVPTAAYTLPPLAGFSLCCSGIPVDDKARIEKLCEEMGAGYSKTLGLTCTHLICHEPTGKKYEFAMSVKAMRIVRKEWVYQCAKNRLLVEEDLFLVGQDAQTGPSDSRTTTEPAATTKKEEPKQHVVQPVAAGPSLSSAVPSATPSVLATHTTSAATREPYRRQFANWSDAKPALYLDAFTFYLSTSTMQDKSVHAPLRAKALRLIACGGGSISEELTPLVNYVVIIRTPVPSAKIPEIERAQRMGVAVVSLEWLERCVLDQRVADEEVLDRYEWGAEDNGLPGDTATQARPQADFRSRLFVGVRCALGPLALYDSGAVSAVGLKLQRGRGKVLPHDGRGVVTSGVATHVVCGESLPAGGRRVVDTARKHNAHVVVVTTAWLDACLQEERLLPVTDCVLFAPVPHETPLREMLRRRLSVTITGHQVPGERAPNRRRDVLARLTRVLGASYSERMTKGKTTHLIADARVGTKSEKIEKARRWGIATVSYKWLLACAEQGDIVDVGDYPVEEDQHGDDMKMEDVDLDEDEVGHETQPGHARSTPRSHRPSGADTKRSLFQSPRGGTQRRSPRLKQEPPSSSAPAASTGPGSGEAGEQLFRRFTDGLLKSSIGDGGVEEPEAVPAAPRRRSARSRSVSLDAHDLGDGREWSLDASQSQVIVHRDLTPPPTPHAKAKRSMPPRAAKRRRQR